MSPFWPLIPRSSQDSEVALALLRPFLKEKTSNILCESGIQMGIITNCESLLFSDAVNSLASHAAIPRGPISVFWLGEDDCQPTLVITIMAVTLESKTANQRW